MHKASAGSGFGPANDAIAAQPASSTHCDGQSEAIGSAQSRTSEMRHTGPNPQVTSIFSHAWSHSVAPPPEVPELATDVPTDAAAPPVAADDAVAAIAAEASDAPPAPPAPGAPPKPTLPPPAPARPLSSLEGPLSSPISSSDLPPHASTTTNTPVSRRISPRTTTSRGGSDVKRANRDKRAFQGNSWHSQSNGAPKGAVVARRIMHGGWMRMRPPGRAGLDGEQRARGAK